MPPYSATPLHHNVHVTRPHPPTPSTKKQKASSSKTPLPPAPAIPPSHVEGGLASRGSNNNNGSRLKRLSNTDNVFTLCKTDEGEKYRCRACHRCFNLKCTLLRHVRHQHQGRFVPHPCPKCGQVFKRTDHLKVHLKKIHQVESASRATRGQSPSAASADIDIDAEAEDSHSETDNAEVEEAHPAPQTQRNQ